MTKIRRAANRRAGELDNKSLNPSAPLRLKSFVLLDTRVVCCGDNLEQFAKLPDACVDYIDYMCPRCVQLACVLKQTGSFYYHCDWPASHYVKVLLDQILENHLQNGWL